MNPQNYITYYKVKVALACFTSVEILPWFALCTAIFQLQIILGQVHGITPPPLPNDLEHYKVKDTSYMSYYCHRVPNFTPFFTAILR